MRKSALHQILAIAVLIGGTVLPMLIPTAWADYHNPAVPDQNSAAYWLDRGGLYATYGNYRAAVKAYQKAMTLDPNQSAIYFDMGVAYGESGYWGEALASINKALSMAPDNARYLYGRAWILLRTGKSIEAMADFQKAAELGSTDAQAYLERRPADINPESTKP